MPGMAERMSSEVEDEPGPRPAGPFIKDPIGPPPPLTGMALRLWEEKDDEPDPRSHRRMVDEGPRIRKKNVSSHDKSRKPEYLAEPIRIRRSQTESPSVQDVSPGSDKNESIRDGCEPREARPTTARTADRFRGIRRDDLIKESASDTNHERLSERRTKPPDKNASKYNVDSKDPKTPGNVPFMRLDEDITVMPRKGPLLAKESIRENGEDDATYRTNKQPQDEDGAFRSRAQRVNDTPSSSHDVTNPPIHTILELELLFSASSQGLPGIYTDANFARISVYLRNTGRASWSVTPRLYTALRLIDHVDALDEFLKLGINDMCFPFSNTTIPAPISPTIKSAFLEIQETVFSGSKSYDMGHGKHVYFSKDDPKPFRTVGLLGKGGHGTVDKVVGQLDQKEYARKLFRRVRGWTKSHIESFRTEVNVLKRVDHIHCVKLISTYSDPRYFALLMTPAGDCNLVKYYEMTQNNNDKLSLLRCIPGCLASAVRYLHDSKIRHRDIKPQNVIIKDDRAYLTDFGIAYSWEALAGATTTADSGKTATYAAPEVIRVEPRNTAADIWSLGCIFFEIATVLSNSSVEVLKANFRQKTGTEAYYANVRNFGRWANGLMAVSTNSIDKFAWMLASMTLQMDPEDRPTAAELFEETVEETHRTGVHFCGPCCLDEDVSTSGSEAGSIDENSP